MFGNITLRKPTTFAKHKRIKTIMQDAKKLLSTCLPILAFAACHEFEENGQLNLSKSKVWLCKNDKLNISSA